MNLLAKRILLLVADGVDERDVEYLKHGLEGQGAEIFLTTAQPRMTVETIADGRRGIDLYIDFPIELADPALFDALIIPDGAACAGNISADMLAMGTLKLFGELGRPVVFSGEAGLIADESAWRYGAALVREGTQDPYGMREIVTHIVSEASTGSISNQKSGSMQKAASFW